MREPVLMPTLSDTMETGHLVEWLKQPGDAVKKGDAIAEVETDKAVMEVEAFYDGYLQGPLAAADTDIAVGAVIGYIGDSVGAETSSPKPATLNVDRSPVARSVITEIKPSATASIPDPASAPASASVPARLVGSEGGAGKRVAASPYARGLAQELGIDLSLLSAGPDGSIHASQVVAAAVGRAVPNLHDGPGYELHPLSPMQRAIANNMAAAAAVPTFRVSARLSLAPLIALADEEGYSLTLLLARACAMAVEAHPRFNAVYTPQGLAQRQQVDVGIAVDVPKGLVTPVLRDVAGRPIEELAKRWSALKRRALGKQRGQHLLPEEYRGATFYLSNLGMFGTVSRFDAVVPQGAAAILAVAAIQEGLAELTLSCDHRVVYGADAARFFETLALLLGDPMQPVLTSNHPSS
ncbi:MAG TPA: 2-oxo acid dehydrogenase subunit E2 [Candidatus Tenderia sp.]|nr:2-oxo acid dehydrogenase subunit E2 [Candidatus Tenderia sp.]